MKLKNIKILPTYLISRYKEWKVTGYEQNKSWYNKIANEVLKREDKTEIGK